MAEAKVVAYKRSRFSTRLPTDRLYALSHFWLAEVEPGLWRIGFTRFATRMLGDFVETGFSVQMNENIKTGQTIGFVEGFKAVTDLFAVMPGAFAGGNPALREDITLADADNYGKGWLYAVWGKPESNTLDVQGYIELLDLTIDKMQSGARAGSDLGHEDDKDPTCPT